jgi:hypothetical protein
MNNPETPGNQVWTIQGKPAIKYEQSRETRQSSMNIPENRQSSMNNPEKPAIKYQQSRDNRQSSMNIPEKNSNQV